ncbi:MAG: GNAT family N-acetyltransferase [Arcticibacter sp.]
MPYQIVSIDEIDRWNLYIERSLHSDFYHTGDYHSLQTKGEPLLFVFEHDDVLIMFPLLKRKIENTEFVDFTSAYGYSGPLSNREFTELDASVMDRFKMEFLQFIADQKCVSVFARLNPFIDHCMLLEKFGGVYENGKTVYMDLTVPLEEQRGHYEKRLRRRIKQLRRKNFRITEGKDTHEIQLFMDLYHENMDRLNASPHYYFDEKYFTGLLNTDRFKSKLLLAYDENTLICGAIVIYSHRIIRNHLSATHPGYLNCSPGKLLTDEISLLGRDLGLEYFHLGGGVAGREDSLFQYKSSFSNLFLEDKVWCYVADPLAYEYLVEMRTPEEAVEIQHFPLYRC